MARPQPVGPLTCRSEKGKYAGGVAPRARRSAPGCPYSPTAPTGTTPLLARVGPPTRACDSSTPVRAQGSAKLLSFSEVVTCSCARARGAARRQRGRGGTRTA